MCKTTDKVLVAHWPGRSEDLQPNTVYTDSSFLGSHAVFHLCFLWSREELRRSRLFLSRLRLRFSRLRLPRSLLQLRCLSPRPGDPLRLLFLCRSLSRSVRSGKTQDDKHDRAAALLFWAIKPNVFRLYRHRFTSGTLRMILLVHLTWDQPGSQEIKLSWHL